MKGDLIIKLTIMKPFLIILRGPAASGKSTIAKGLWKKIPNTALVQLDNIKWLVSGYKSSTQPEETYIDISIEIGLKMAKTYLSNGINVIVEKAFINKKRLSPFISYAKKNSFKFFIYDIEAPWKVIKKRIGERNQKMSLKKAKAIFDNYKSNINAIKFNTSKISARGISNLIKSEVWGKLNFEPT